MDHLALFTTRIPHHSSHSGYEQLITYLPGDEVVERMRANTSNPLKKIAERAGRLFSASKWYLWDGIEAERKTLKLARRYGNGLTAHFLYGDTAIGLLPYVWPRNDSRLILSIHATPTDLPEVIQKPRLLQNVDHLILLGENQKPFFEEHGISNDRMSVIPHGVDVDHFVPQKSDKNASEDGPLKVLMVGNWRRNFALYATVVQQLSSNPAFQFEIVTADFNHHHFSDFKQVTLQSGLSDAELLVRYQQSDVMLLGVEDAVANNVLLEAMACGLPVVAERVGALPEYLPDAYPGLFPAHDADRAVELLKRLHADKKLRALWGDQLHQHAQSFRWNRIAKQITDLYQEVSNG